jgi:hypothetical protein
VQGGKQLRPAARSSLRYFLGGTKSYMWLQKLQTMICTIARFLHIASPISLWNFHNGFRYGAARYAGTGFVMEIP